MGRPPWAAGRQGLSPGMFGRIELLCCEEFWNEEEGRLARIEKQIFHYSGKFELNGDDWIYVGGRSSMSTIELTKLSISELKMHLTDHLSCSDLALQNTTLHWKYSCGDLRSVLLEINDAKSVQMMASHVTHAGVLDIYATVPRDVSSEASDQKEQLSAKQASSETETGHIQARQTEQTENIQREETWRVQREETEQIQPLERER
ncbi:hypothetical protein D1007_34665 [Hordeum vulgare]|nr:hypothetical protein D1007_34665 [Hordeum vulgare]